MAGINISPYQAYNQTHNYSSLFAGLNKASSDNGWDLSGLADYASIKNGSYGKLMKSTYAKNNAKSSETESTKRTIKTAEERRKEREARANKTVTTGSEEKALTTKDVAAAGIGETTAEAATAIAAQDSAKAIYSSNALASPSMSELMATNFDTNI